MQHLDPFCLRELLTLHVHDNLCSWKTVRYCALLLSFAMV